MLKNVKKTLMLMLICITVLFALIAFCMMSSKTVSAYASAGAETSVDVSANISDFTDLKYISNADYFKANPRHAINNGSDNAKGSCTTVAVQMLMGYHNYYSDRRLIPEFGENGVRFLSANYGDINDNPLVKSTPGRDYGRASIGTEDGLYKEILDLTLFSDLEGIGQAVYLVKDGAVKFVNKYSPIKENVSITAGLFSEEAAKEEIDAGRPIVLGMAVLGDKNFHVVNAYGYAKYNGVQGFITHYGYRDDKTQIWVPSSWFGFQITMNVEHIHSFKDKEINLIDTYREIECETCGYTGVDSLYDINTNGTIVRLRYPLNKAITIPENIGGIEVKAIGSSVFANQTNITEINIPSSVKSIGNGAFLECNALSRIYLLYDVITIGNNAFENCYNLTSLYSLNNVQNIGSYAFKGCKLLSHYNIPKSLETIGDGAFAGCHNLEISVSEGNTNYCTSGNILFNKDKTNLIAAGKILSDITIPSTVTKISPYAFWGNSNLKTVRINESCTSIGSFAFENCENLTSVYFYAYSVPQIQANSFAVADFTLYVPRSVQAEYYSAFVGFTNKIDSIPITVTLVSDNKVINTLNTYFGATIVGLEDPFKTGYNFVGWYDNAEYDGDIYINNGLWDSKVDFTLYAKWTARQFYITFAGYGSDGLEDKLVTYDEPIGKLPTPTKTGYTFVGWKDEHNVYYTSDTILQRTSNLSLTSDFKVNEYVISYNGNGGNPSADSQTVNYGSVVNTLATASRDGYTFKEWNTQADGKGDKVSAPFTYNNTDNLTLYAQYTANKYFVMFDNDGGDGEANGVEATYNLPMPTDGLTAPIRRGYTFQGYYTEKNGKGIPYYNADMTSANDCNFLKQTTLYANWKANEYDVYLDAQNGSEISTVKATYNSPMPTENITAPTRKGYTFQGYYTEKNGSGTPYYNANMTSANVCNFLEPTTLYANWNANEYTVILKSGELTGGTDSVKATYMAPMPSAIAPQRFGYIFQGYYADLNDEETKYYNADMSSARDWDIASDCTLYARWEGISSTITFEMEGGSGGTKSTTAYFGSEMPTEDLVAPTRTDYIFKGYYEELNGNGKKYYDGPNMESAHDWDKIEDTKLYAYWEKVYYSVTLHYGGGLSGSDTVSVAYGETMPLPYGRDSAPIHRGYEFVGYFSGENGSGTQYYSMEVHSGSDSRYYERLVPLRRWYSHSNGDLYGYWKPLECDYTYENVKLNDGYFDEKSTVYLKHGTTATITAKTFEGYKFLYFNRGGVQVSSQTVTWDIELKRSEDDGKVRPVDGFFAVYDKDECIAAGSLITLADGRQVTVESLTGNEELLVWNLYTGMYDTAPILFIDSDPSGLYEVIKLYFSDGTQVKVISEHGFWDYNLNEYVYLNANAYEYIGHWFNKGETKVQLTDVEITEEYTTPYSPVTYGHLCYFVDGMLSMPGGIDGLFNIFAVDAETMKYDESAMAADIERYGLFTYEEFAELVPVSEEVFNAFNGLYLKVAIGKGLIDTDRLLSLAQRYAEFF